jgi:putative DNA primase/helicase
MSDYIEFLDGKKYPKKNADKANNHEAFKDAGYLLKENDLVVDSDKIPKHTLEKMISFFNIKTQIVWTEKGAHFYFKKPEGFKGNKTICPLGFEIEYKHTKNTPNGLTIKQGGKMRKIENMGIREDLPDVFKYFRNLKSLVGMEDNDGRNSSLFAHRMRIYNLPQWKSIMRFINNNIFAEPLEEKEFQELIRDGVKPKAQINNQPELADYLKKEYRIVSYLGKIYWFIHDKYTSDDEAINRIIADEVPSMKTTYYKEIKNQMEYKATIIPPDKILDIKFQNGILRNGLFYPIDYKEFTPYTIDIPFYDDADPVQEVNDYLDFLSENDLDFKSRLLEMLAHPLIVNRDFKRMLGKLFIIVGGGGNGKGTLLSIIAKILGEQNCSTLSIKQMADERYFNSMFGMLANLGDDIEDEFISKESVKMLKNISTCDRVQMRRLHENSKDVQLTTSLIFTSNHILKAREKGESWKRRIDWVPMYPTPEKKDPKLVEKLTTPKALRYWIRLIVEAYQRLYENESFTSCKRVEKFNEEYHLFNDNMNQFLEENPSKEDWIGKGKKEAYRQYKEWCLDNDEHAQGKEKLFNKIMDQFNLDYGQIHIRDKDKDTTTTGFKEKN